MKAWKSTGQTLLTKPAYDLARASGESLPEEARWLAHGLYELQDIPDPVEIFEVGLPRTSPLAPPAEGEKVHWIRDPAKPARLPAPLTWLVIALFLIALVLFYLSR
jgi:hypothetical protein